LGKRGGYYDNSGALRDMIQNHLLQLLCVIAMDCPPKYEAETIRNAKVNVLKQVRIYKEAQVFTNVVRAQYKEGSIDNIPQHGYRKEEHVAKNSTTETYVAARLFIDNARWKNVPFYLRTGKCMPKQTSMIVLQFKDSPHRFLKMILYPIALL
jgi:glucose-6-phosphate 1-dehydrogenase